jgi:hypothetical protein
VKTDAPVSARGAIRISDVTERPTEQPPANAAGPHPTRQAPYDSAGRKSLDWFVVSADQAAPPRPRSIGREFASNPRRRFPGSHQFRRRLESFRHEPFAPLALALEVCPVNGGSGFELGKFGFQRLNARRKRRRDRLMIVSRAGHSCRALGKVKGTKGIADAPASPGQQPVYECSEGSRRETETVDDRNIGKRFG